MSGPDAGLRYLRAATEALERAGDERADAVRTAGSWIADAVGAGGLLAVTGSGHSHMLAEEVFYRAGGLVAVLPILDPALMLHDAAVSGSRVERLSGLAEIRIDAAGIGPDDLLVVASNSGRNAYPIEAALAAQARGTRVVALTSVAHARSVPARHPGGRRLFEIADLVLDTDVPPGDACLSVRGVPVPVGPLSTVVASALLQAAVASAIERLAERGTPPPVLRSANVDDDDDAPDLTEWAKRVPPLR